MKTKLVPLIVMLLAGAACSITTKLMHYELVISLWILLAVLIVFYIVGCIFKRTLDSFEKEIEEQAALEEENVSDEGEVIEKEATPETDEEREEGEENPS